MANFNKVNSNFDFSFGTKKEQKQKRGVMSVSLNLKKGFNATETVLGKTHNGRIFRNTKEESAFAEFRLFSNVQGFAHAEGFDDKGNHATLDLYQWLMEFFQASAWKEVPDTKFICDLGDDTEVMEELESGARSITYIFSPGNLFYIGKKSHNKREWHVFRIELDNVEFSTQVIGGKRIDKTHVQNCMSASVTSSEAAGAGFLSQFRLTEKAPAQQMANQTSEQNEEEGFDEMITL